jgi:metallo-beta-lactamase family protein
MAEGGRILHHLRNNIGDPKNMVLFVGYAAAHTLARRIMDGNESVKIFGEEHKVRCTVKKMDDFSAHADQKELLEYLKFLSPKKLGNIFLVHGEEDQALPFRQQLIDRGYPSVIFPSTEEEFEV